MGKRTFFSIHFGIQSQSNLDLKSALKQNSGAAKIECQDVFSTFLILLLNLAEFVKVKKKKSG